MATNITVKLEHHPGELARLGEALGTAGVNVDGMCAVTSAGAGIIHLLVEDAAAARAALAAAGMAVDAEREVLVVEAIEDQPGALGEIARRVADAGVNLDLAYLATNTRVVLGADDLEKARAALYRKNPRRAMSAPAAARRPLGRGLALILVLLPHRAEHVHHLCRRAPGGGPVLHAAGNDITIAHSERARFAADAQHYLTRHHRAALLVGVTVVGHPRVRVKLHMRQQHLLRPESTRARSRSKFFAGAVFDIAEAHRSTLPS